MAKKLPPIHPGEILREEFLVPLRLTPYAVAAALHVPRTRIERIARPRLRVVEQLRIRQRPVDGDERREFLRAIDDDEVVI